MNPTDLKKVIVKDKLPVSNLLDFPDNLLPVLVALPDEDIGALPDHDPAHGADRVGDEPTTGFAHVKKRKNRNVAFSKISFT